MATLDDEFNSYLTLDDEFNSYPEINKDTVPVKAKPAPAPAPAPREETGFGDAFKMAAGNIAGAAPRALALDSAATAIEPKAHEHNLRFASKHSNPLKFAANAAFSLDPDAPNPLRDVYELAKAYFQNKDGARDKFSDTYNSALKSNQEKYAQAAKDQPVATVLGGLGQGAALASLGVGTNPLASAGLGAATGWLGSQDDLISLGAARDAGIGGILGHFGYKAPIKTGLGIAGYGALTGDWATGLSGLLGAGAGAVGHYRTKAAGARAKNTELALEEPRANIAKAELEATSAGDKVTAAGKTLDAAKLAQQRAQTAAEFANADVRALNVKKAEQLERKIIKDAQRTSDARNQEFVGKRKAVLQELDQKAALEAKRQETLQKLVDAANDEYQRRLAGLKPATKSRPLADAKLEMMKADLQSDLADLPGSFAGKVGNESQAQMGRWLKTKALGKDVPPSVKENIAALEDTFLGNNERVFSRTPQEIAQEFVDKQAARINQKLGILDSKAQEMRQPPPDLFADPKMKEAAYALAKELDLNPGDIAKFNPRGRFPLNDPKAPPPTGTKLDVLKQQLAGMDEPTVVRTPNNDPKLTPEVRRRLYMEAKNAGLDVSGVKPEAFDPFATYGVAYGSNEVTNPGRGSGVAAPATGPKQWEPGMQIPPGTSPMDLKINKAQAREQAALLRLAQAKEKLPVLESELQASKGAFGEAQGKAKAAKDLIADPDAYVKATGKAALKSGATQGALNTIKYSAGGGILGGVVGGGGLGVGTAVGLTGGGALGGALQAAYRNPAAKAVLYGAIEKALVVNPAMAQKYGGFLGGQQGSNLGNAVFALATDPELRDAVELELASANGASPR